MRSHALRVQPSFPEIKRGWVTEFKGRNICLKSKNPARFVKCQWHYERDPCACYLVYRWVLAAGFTTGVACNVVVRLREHVTVAAWITRLSGWVWLTCALQILLAALMVTLCYAGKWKRSERLVAVSLYPYPVYWLLNTVATDMMILVSYRFWTDDYRRNRSPHSKGIFILKLLTYFITPFLIIVDFWIVSHTMKIFHVVYSLLFHITYDIASYIFYWAGLPGGMYVISWTNPKKRLLDMSLENYGIVILIHIITFLMQKLRKALYFLLWKYCRYPLEGIGQLVADEELVSPKLSSPQLSMNYANNRRTRNL